MKVKSLNKSQEMYRYSKYDLSSLVYTTGELYYSAVDDDIYGIMHM